MKHKNKKTTKLFYCIILIAFQFVFHANATDWYVDNEATGVNNGTSWEDAWQSFADINWDLIEPGDMIYISGGETEKIYTDRLLIADVNGTVNSPVTIKVGQDQGHNGNVVITNDGPTGGIAIKNSTYVTIDGNIDDTQKMKITDCTVSGIYIVEGNSHHLKLTYLDISNNGDGTEDHGIVMRYNGNVYPVLEVSYCKIHNNWHHQFFIIASAMVSQDFGGILVHHNEIYDVRYDGFECSAGGVDFYNNMIHTRVGAGGHSDGMQLYGEYYRIYNNVFRNFNQEGLSSTSYIYINTGHSTVNRPAKEIYIFNNLFYDNEIYTTPTSLRGILFAPQDGVPSISNILITNNTIIGMPTTGMSLSFKNVSGENIENVIIANNIISNCYTNEILGVATSITGISNDSIIDSFGSNSEIVYDNNIIYEGENGDGCMGYNGDFINSYGDFVDNYNLNINGAYIDPSLDSEYKPDDRNDPTVDAGLDLSTYFTTDIEGVSRPQGVAWDIGAYEYTTGTNMLSVSTENKENFRVYPNPFTYTATIEYTLPVGSDVEIILYDLTGRIIKNLYSGYQSAGIHTLNINIGGLSKGTYFCRMKTELYDITKKCIISE